MTRKALAAGIGASVLAATLAAAPAAFAQDAAAQQESPAPSAAATDNGDPFEKLNRGLFRIHKGLDHAVVGPVARTYTRVVPGPARRGLRNVLDNLGEPLTFVNDVLQLKPKRAGTTFARFTLNSTVGVAGLFDVAGKMDMPIHYEDFGQTLGRWGVGPGPYIFVPLVGPTNLRDGIGRIGDWQVTPLAIDSWNVTEGERFAVAAVDSLDYRASLDAELSNVENTATDEYATVRSAYAQNRKAEIADGVTSTEDLPDFDAPAPEPQKAPAQPNPAPASSPQQPTTPPQP